MKDKSIEKLEFNKVKEILETFATTLVGKQNCKDLFPLNSSEEIKKSLAQTTQSCSLIYRKGNLPELSISENFNEYLKLLEISYTLPIKGLLVLNNLLKSCSSLKDYFFSNEIDMSKYESLEHLFNNIYTNPSISEQINKVILDENTISDNASPTLNSIRKQINSKESDIKSKLNNLLHTKYVQEPIITKRNGRFVIPIKTEYQSEIKGFIHDTSSSGLSVFIEPISVFELNNEINSLKNAENIEIEKILQKLSSLFLTIIPELKNNYTLIGLIDFIFAKAKYSIQLDAIEPIISEDKSIDLIDCFHPLLDKKTAVKNNISLGKNYSSLIITGPNTGGKTVTLKTVGLLCLMAKSGLHIPAKQNSKIYIFDYIFADIGDEQNISDSLSTFSSHITNISKILKQATSNSLVLLDELGSGTDPNEGENLAISILDHLYNNKITTIATTHFSKLKKYAISSDGFENASVEFDINTMSPTYKLLIGVPGRSNAFEISKKLGISNEIIDKARNLMDTTDINFENLLKKIYEDKRIIEKEKELILENSSKVKSLKQDLEDEYSSLKSKEKELISKAKQDAKQILLDAKEDANQIIKDLEKSSSSKEANKIRNKLNDKIIDLSENKESIIDNNNRINIKDLKPGYKVHINSINQDGTVLSTSTKENKVKIQIGVIKSYFDLNDLSLSKEKKEKNIPKRQNKEFIIKQISPEINVIGKNVDEACFIIDKYLDDCVLNGLSTVRIVHGKGTGTLRKGIQEFLKTHPHVKDFRIGTFGEGEMGVTVVNIK